MMKQADSLLRAIPILGLCITSVAFAGNDPSQLKADDWPFGIVEEMERNGCKMTEQAMFDYILSHGGGISDAQATIVNMANAGHIRMQNRESYTLVGYGKCR